MTSFIQNNKYFILGSLLILALLGFFTLTLKAQWVVENINLKDRVTEEELFQAFNKKGEPFIKLSLPKQDPARLNILMVGMRGEGVGFGDYLTDTLILFSLDQQTGKAAIISIPRDLYISLPYSGKMKINEVYSIGLEKGGEKLAFGLTKTVLSQITGVYIDDMVRVDFDGFKKIIDTVGGIDVYLPKPFSEYLQWQGVGGFRLPAGWNHLSGDQALFYARSRFSTSDFDRARRQHDIILALKTKLTNLGILSNPVKIYNILDAIGTHVKTDANIGVPEALALVNKIDYRDIIHVLLTTENYLYHSTASNGAYILLPKGDTFTQIQDAIRNVFIKPTLPSGLGVESSNERTLDSSHPLQNTPTTH